METMYPAATFTASRDELLGDAVLLGAAEIARAVCRDADRLISVLAVTPTRMRRIDGWTGAAGFVTHAASPNATDSIVGSVCDREPAARLTEAIVMSLVGELPRIAAPEPAELPALDELSPATVPSELEWIVVMAVVPTSRPAATGHTVAASTSGLLLGTVEALDRPTRLLPADGAVFRRALEAAVGAAPRSLRELLDDD